LIREKRKEKRDKRQRKIGSRFNSAIRQVQGSMKVRFVITAISNVIIDLNFKSNYEVVLTLNFLS